MKSLMEIIFFQVFLINWRSISYVTIDYLSNQLIHTFKLLFNLKKYFLIFLNEQMCQRKKTMHFDKIVIRKT